VPNRTLTLYFDDLDDAVGTIEGFAARFPLDSVVGVDDPTALLAASRGVIRADNDNQYAAAFVAGVGGSVQALAAQMSPWVKRAGAGDLRKGESGGGVHRQEEGHYICRFEQFIRP
jgi:hypothetical protein